MRSSLRILPVLFAICLNFASMAQTNQEFDPMTAPIEENIQHPAVAEKYKKAVSQHMSELKEELNEAGYEATLVRSGEVVMITMSCSDLFMPNETSLSAKASSKLDGLKPFLKRRDDFKVVLAVHSDNTGDTTYADRLTAERANAIDDYYYNEDSQRETGIIPYGIGSDEPVADNHGLDNRAKNRRVEFYFIPTQEYINKARKR